MLIFKRTVFANVPLTPMQRKFSGQQLSAEQNNLSQQHHFLVKLFGLQECDVKNAEQVQRTFEEVRRHFGRVDVLVCSAGILGDNSLPQHATLKDWREVFAVNVEGVMRCAQAVHPIMAENGGGKIIIMSSMEGRFGVDNQAAYCASKGALSPLCKSLAMAWAPHNIQVNCVSPGHVGRTFVNPILVHEDNKDKVLKTIPAGRLGTVEDVVGAVVFLAGQASNYVTGTEIVVDGGTSARSQSC
eukprot:TRINITY_DN6061_c1_g2_i1.p1 TRINITY_DN6061_c1_g2~~TRINITY_DN6061_c1_g2_i1.p1  ORF type:complete len:278 (-),score=23.27 TRINITY_DN6061_c1_g2_i1:348-1076(-)